MGMLVFSGRVWQSGVSSRQGQGQRSALNMYSCELEPIYLFVYLPIYLSTYQYQAPIPGTATPTLTLALILAWMSHSSYHLSYDLSITPSLPVPSLHLSTIPLSFFIFLSTHPQTHSPSHPSIHQPIPSSIYPPILPLLSVLQ